MILRDCNDNYLAKVKPDEKLPNELIRTVIIETPEEERDLRLFLTGALKVNESGCHALGRDFGVNALAVNPDVSNGDAPLGSDSSKGTGLKFDYSLEDKLQIIDTLSAAIQRNEPMAYLHTKEAETKLLALVQSI